MAMSISAASPSSSPAPQSPQSSVDGSNGPSTPVSPSQVQTLSLPPPSEPMTVQSDASAQPNSTTSTAPGQTQKRKPSRRANTAERRATHNAVERARRETLNGRFLDLAALLPNLSQIRRPSKSSIVNSSIAHIHASRRHRLLAARELRLLKLESDALRRELNEWRDRAGLPRIDEPVRGEGFQMIMSGEVEILSAGPIEEEEAGEDEYGDEEGAPAPSYGAHPGTSAMPPMADEPPFAHNVHHGHGHAHHLSGHGLHLQTMIPRGHTNNGIPSPMIVHSPQAVSFENPAMASIYDPPHMGQYFSSSVNDNPNQKWSGMPYGGQQQFTPPQSSHGYNGMYAGQRGYPQQRYAHQQQDNDDASSVGSAGQSPVPAGVGMGMVKRERSGSMGSVGSNGQEMPGVLGGASAMGRRQQQQQQQWPGEEGYGMGMGGMGMGGGSLSGMGMGGRGATAALAVGGGNAFGAMML
ncbi:hypothetical protein BDY19DRAFT_701613 [Irpex rosettiformis]|uniref:Uncharacterized protein n=1 Tax=Irpex rosettiformis TaxID=378272 RepID=A0ACB8TN13_9APHY|nr:hypothetical protein BDY19DRAFT_701613 [Irpex rosettiformis]